MGYLALYRKYRPVDFNSVYGQEEVVTVIKNAIVSGKVTMLIFFVDLEERERLLLLKLLQD